MKAIVQRSYGAPDVLKLEEVQVPSPKDHEVQVEVAAVSINGSDWEALRGKPLYARIGGLRSPGNAILGSDIAGRVQSVGRNVQQFQPGDEVFGEMTDYHGGFAEVACTSEKLLARKPAGLTFEQAAAIPQAGVIAWQGLREKGQVQPGQSVLINGAGGSAGTFAVQLAKLYGADVTGVDNPAKLDFVRSLGADHAIDYTREDFTHTGKQYDLILDVIARRSVFNLQRAVKPGGVYYIVGGSVATMLQVLLLGSWIQKSTGKNLRVLAVQRNQKDLLAITELCLTGKIIPVIDRVYPLSEAAEALRYVGEGHAQGKVVLTVASV
jgi:NADPH:quinone reductase-like Zn-dependent oxidoreductase